MQLVNLARALMILLDRCCRTAAVVLVGVMLVLDSDSSDFSPPAIVVKPVEPMQRAHVHSYIYLESIQPGARTVRARTRAIHQVWEPPSRRLQAHRRNVGAMHQAFRLPQLGLADERRS